ncbi:excinuclease ABC subunit C [Chlamydia abortus]|nr:excinuclease ABC subunit C [Chlamydia abortus]SHE15639.1 excinuclease ABC subunit C [Chlamydia abortus]
MLIDENNNEIKINDKSIFNFLSRMQTIVDRYVKNVYQKKELEYILDNELLNIKGIGKKTIMKLLSTFNTYQNILNASYEDLEKASSSKIAKLIKGY